MDNNNLFFVDDLNPKRDFWNIKARIIRLWNLKWRIDMVLLDERGKKIQATVKEKLIPDFVNKLREDDVVVLKKFGVGEQQDKYPVVDSKIKINFYRCTEVTHVADFDGHPYGFVFVPFEEITEQMATQVLNIDVIGNVVWCGDLEYFKTKIKESKKVTFEMQDLSERILRCTLWDDYAIQFNSFISHRTNNEHVIVIIQHGKIKMWDGNITVQNDMFGTRVFINENIDDINSFRQRLIDNDAGPSASQSILSSQTVYPTRNDFIVKTERKHIDELREIKEMDFSCVVLGTIKLLEEEFGWFYIACRKCGRKPMEKSEYLGSVNVVTPELENAESNSLWCYKCKSKATSLIPRFKVQVRVQDATGSVSFVLFDKDVSQIVGLSANDIRERQFQTNDTETFPHELNVMLNKRFAFKIVISRYNIERKYHVYTVIKFSDDPEIIAELENGSNDDQQGGEGCCVRLSDSSQCAVDLKDCVSATGESLISDVEKDSANSPAGKRCIQDICNEMNGDQASTTKAVKKKLRT